jgi:hypothetical protein
MKLRLISAALLVLGTLITTVCRKTETETAQLDELPKDIAASLKRLPNSQLLVSVPPAITSTPVAGRQGSADSGVTHPEIKCQTTYRYFVQVTDPAPITYCSPIRADLDAISAYDAAMSPGPRPPGNVKRYRLSSFQGKALLTPILCQYANGPWLAVISKTVDCRSQEHCTMTIAVPWSPVYKWDGDHCEATNRPPELHIFDQIVDAGIVSSSGCSAESTCP